MGFSRNTACPFGAEHRSLIAGDRPGRLDASLSLRSLTLSRVGEGRAALPLADGWHHFFAKQFDGAHGRLV